MSELEDEIRILAMIECAAAKKEIAWINQRLARLKVEREQLDRRESQLISDHAEARARLLNGQAALEGKKP
jgi:hypothetical protein